MKTFLKKLFVVLMACLLLAGCGGNGDTGSGEEEQQEKVWSAVFITSTPRGNEFTDLIWDGFLQLEAEGWKVDCIETFETAEITEQVRASVENGYDIIYTQGDDVMAACKDLMSEIRETHPDTQFVYLDTYEETTDEKTCAVTIDPFEACFIAGYVAACESETHEVGVMLPLLDGIILRFEAGYYAGLDYADSVKGTTTTHHTALTNDWTDTTKGYEAGKTLVSSYPNIDLMIQCAYVSGYGTIQACDEMQLRCIGVDNWQGYLSDYVFWSAIKSMDLAVYGSANKIKAGEDIGRALEFNLNDGGKAYYEPDLANLKEGLADEVKQMEQDILSGKLDIFANGYEEWRVTDTAQAD